MTMSDWHISVRDLDRYLGEHRTPALDASVDAHLIGCPTCRASLTERVDQQHPRRSAERWDAVADLIDRPSPGAMERLLRRLGLADHVTRPLVATPRLVSAWLLALVLTVGFALLMSWSGSGRSAILIFLIAAPLLPMAGTAIAYSSAAEPPRDIALTTAGRGQGLLFARTLFVLCTAMPFLWVGGVFLPGPSIVAVAWVLPALGLTAATVAMATWFDSLRCAIALGAIWSVIVAESALTGRRWSLDHFAHHLAPAQGATQIACLALLVLAATVTLLRRGRYSYRSAS